MLFFMSEEEKKRSQGVLLISIFSEVKMAHEEKIESKFICVWLDNQLMKSEDYVDTQDQLETLIFYPHHLKKMLHRIF
jgi:hypothetical protein